MDSLNTLRRDIQAECRAEFAAECDQLKREMVHEAEAAGERAELLAQVHILSMCVVVYI